MDEKEKEEKQKKEEFEEVPGEEKVEGGEDKVEEPHPPEADQKAKEEQKQEEEKEAEKDDEVSYPDTDELSISRFLISGVRLILISLLLTSVLYTLVTTGIGNLVWQDHSQGSLVQLEGEVVGSRLIGQSFNSERYFHPRPSSKNYDAMDSGSANLSPQNEQLTRRATQILEKLEEKGASPEEVPVSLVTESGSALDPHIVPESAHLQVPRVSEATGIDPERLREVIEDNTQGKLLGLYGQQRVNVLALNLEIETILGSE